MGKIDEAFIELRIANHNEHKGMAEIMEKMLGLISIQDEQIQALNQERISLDLRITKIEDRLNNGLERAIDDKVRARYQK